MILGCDPGVTIIFENRMPFPVKVGSHKVSLDFQGTVTPRDLSNYPIVIEPGKSRKFTALIPPDRKLGATMKYVEYAVNLTGEMVYQRTFTWDELHDMGWRVVIEPLP